jgi:hypothetical protein
MGSRDHLVVRFKQEASTRRLVAKHRQVQAEDLEALDALADHWADVFLDELTQDTNIDEESVEKVLDEKGISADNLNALADADPTQKSSGFISALGGRILHSIWHMVIGPFLAVGKLIKSGEFRAQVKASFKRALRHEVRSTRHMVEVAGRLARGEEVGAPERKAAMHQLVDILSKVVLIYFVGPHIAHLFMGGIWKVLGTLVSPLDEILTAMLDKPLRKASKKLLGADIGMLPSGFYTHF